MKPAIKDTLLILVTLGLIVSTGIGCYFMGKFEILFYIKDYYLPSVKDHYFPAEPEDK